MTVLLYQQKKQQQEKIAMITCYDYSSARLLNNTNIDTLLVGDSVAMVMYGFENTLSATVDMMVMHTQAVKRGAPNKFTVTDLPFLSYRKSLSDSVDVVQMIMQAGASAVKLEGAQGNFELIEHLTASGVPVMGHLGLTPQFVHQFGGYKVQGKDHVHAKEIINQALQLQYAGCFAIVLECVPHQLATEITQHLTIPTIGIGAGFNTDGQVLVFQDMLGFDPALKFKFVRQFANTAEHVSAAIESYVNAIQQGEFPQDEHCFHA